VKKLSEESLGNVALHFLRKHSASRKGLVQLLERKVRLQGDVPLSEARGLIDQVVARMEQDGSLDDARMAESKTASLQRQGKSSRVIELKLREKGIDPALAKRSALTTPEVEFESACRLVKKKRLGVDPERKQKDFAVLMRAGFTSDMARRALQAATEPEPEPAEVAEVVRLPRQTAPVEVHARDEVCQVIELPLRPQARERR
jgi:SOS response regulatory protein OraA/RecX